MDEVGNDSGECPNYVILKFPQAKQARNGWKIDQNQSRHENAGI
jgi:hypothetical protein